MCIALCKTSEPMRYRWQAQATREGSGCSERIKYDDTSELVLIESGAAKEW